MTRQNGTSEAAPVTFGAPPLPDEGAFTFVVLPDTQYYSEKYPETFVAQTKWIVAERRRRSIACVLHLGDITEHNVPGEWASAAIAMQHLHGQVPYALTIGNHDYSDRGTCTNRQTLFNDYFSVPQMAELPTFAGVYDREPSRLENSFHIVTVANRRFLILALEFGPRDDVMRWANDIASKYNDHEIILITHAFVYYDNSRYDWAKYGNDQKWNPHKYEVAQQPGGVNDGEELWQALLNRHENFVLAINGHVKGDGLGRLVSQTPTGRSVHQMLVNFQDIGAGGDGWLRLLEFKPDGVTVQVYDYSPTLNQQNQSPQNMFSMKLSPVSQRGSLDPIGKDAAWLARAWTHSHEEDSQNNRVFRPSERTFPRSRGRMSFELNCNGEMSLARPGATDQEETVRGTWMLEGSYLVFRIDDRGEERFEVLHVEEDQLVLNRN